MLREGSQLFLAGVSVFPTLLCDELEDGTCLLGRLILLQESAGTFLLEDIARMCVIC